MRILSKREVDSVAGGMVPINSGGGGGGGGGGTTTPSYCISAQTAQSIVNWSEGAGEVTFGSAGAALGAWLTGGYSEVIQAAGGFATGDLSSKLGTYAGGELANSGISAYTDLVNVANYLGQEINAATVAGGTGAGGWVFENFSYSNACQYYNPNSGL